MADPHFQTISRPAVSTPFPDQPSHGGGWPGSGVQLILRGACSSHIEGSAAPLPDPSADPRGKGVYWVFHPPPPRCCRKIWLRDECRACRRDPGVGRMARELLSYSRLWTSPSGAAAARAEGRSQIQMRAARGQFTWKAKQAPSRPAVAQGHPSLAPFLHA